MPYDFQYLSGASQTSQRLLDTGSTRTQQAFQQMAPRPEQFVPGPQENWDYETATHDMQGNPLPEGALQFDPYGRPYFGSDLMGTLQRYKYEFTKDVDAPTAAKWDEISQNWKNIAETAMTEKPSVEGFGDFALGTLGNAWNTFTTAWQGGESNSLLSIPLKTVRVGGTAIMEGLGGAAIKAEQLGGAHRAMREYVSGEPVDIDRTGNKYIDWAKGMGDLALNMFTPHLSAYNAYKFFTAPGTLKEKKEFLDKGWDEGRLLYTSFVEPAVRQEYRQRVEEGKDPYLLAMELENPFAEMAGQMILDPLNLLGALGKGGKVGRRFCR